METLIRLKLTPRPDTVLELRGRLASVVGGEIERGMGVEFLFRSSEEQRLITAEVARLRVSSEHRRSRRVSTI